MGSRRTGRYADNHVALGLFFRGADRAAQHGKRRVGGRPRHRLDPLGKASQWLRREIERTRVRILADSDEQGSPVDGERRKIAGKFLVRGSARRDLAFQFEVVAFFEQALADGLLKIGL